MNAKCKHTVDLVGGIFTLVSALPTCGICERGQLQAEVDRLRAANHALDVMLQNAREDLGEVEHACDAMRPVFEAARAWREAISRAVPGDQSPMRTPHAALIAAIDSAIALKAAITDGGVAP